MRSEFGIHIDIRFPPCYNKGETARKEVPAMEVSRFYRNVETPHVNTLPPRAYFIPFEAGEDPAQPREKSARFVLLNGSWEFRYFANVEALPLEDPAFPGSVECAGTLPVPSCWQLHPEFGCDPPGYINQDYPFPVDPPYLPDAIPCGFYRRRFSLKKEAQQTYTLCFEGVSAGFYVWVNGAFAGYSQVSHCTGEFDVTPLIADGENVLEALAVKHSTGSYMEDQDFFRLSGIFRDVYILRRDTAHVFDIQCVQCVSEDLGRASLEVRLTAVGDICVKARLVSPDGSLAGTAEGSRTLRFDVASPVLWDPERPRLYTLFLAAGNERIALKPGFKRVEIKGRALLLNGKKIKLRGVNRHDTDPKTGYTVSMETMRREVALLKRANVNAVRTSHYPNDPRFLELCDEAGLLLIDEADLETHGMGYNYGDWYWDYWAHICNDPLWEAQCVDRAARLYERDKNRACVLLWSLGNESGCGENHRKMARYIRGRDEAALIHYENAHLEYAARVGRDLTDISDVESRMYAPLSYLEAYLKDESLKKPFFYCEYVSAWSTGDIPLHWEGFEEHDAFLGGCVWEFKDHAVDTGAPGAPRYRYGGDWNEYPNDGISCLDGVVYPDLTPRPGYYDMKECYKPAAFAYENGKLTVRSKRFFTDLSDLKLDWALLWNGVPALTGTIPTLDIPAGGQKQYPLCFKPSLPGTLTLDVFLRQNAGTPYAEAGYEVGRGQFLLQNAPMPLPAGEPSALTAEQDRTRITVRAGDTVYGFDRLSGRLDSVAAAGEELLSSPMELGLFRAFLRNHPDASVWARARYIHAEQKTYSAELTSATSQKAVIVSEVSFAAAALPPAVRARVAYTFYADGSFTADVSAKVTANAPALPRFGFAFSMPRSFKNARYFGYGPEEAYADKKDAQTLGLYSFDALSGFPHMPRPTECGAHVGTKLALVTNDAGRGLAVADRGTAGFVFSARPYSDLELHNTSHGDAFPPPDRVWVHADYKLQPDCGCRREQEPELCFTEKSFAFSFAFRPLI